MGKKKIVIYAISKNESRCAERWARSMGEADEVVVLDTGSTDGTPDILRANGVRVVEKTISPWRFDTARNESMTLIPDDADICLTTDLDEYFAGGGWAEEIRTAFVRAEEKIASIGRDFEPIVDFDFVDLPTGCIAREKFPAHRRGAVRWDFAVHEEMFFTRPTWPGFASARLLHDRRTDGHDAAYIKTMVNNFGTSPSGHDAAYLSNLFNDEQSTAELSERLGVDLRTIGKEAALMLSGGAFDGEGAKTEFRKTFSHCALAAGMADVNPNFAELCLWRALAASDYCLSVLSPRHHLLLATLCIKNGMRAPALSVMLRLKASTDDGRKIADEKDKEAYFGLWDEMRLRIPHLETPWHIWPNH